MKLRRPSPAMTVAVIALVMSMTGGAIAAVNFAKNAGAVDGKSAVKAGASTEKAAGKLVATYSGGKNEGKLPFRFLSGAASQDSLEDLSDAVARGRNGTRLFAVPDNGVTVAQTMVDLGLGDLQVACADQQDNVGTENAVTRIGITNKSGGRINLVRQTGNGAPAFSTLETGLVDTFSIPNENTFNIQLQGPPNRTVLVEGAAIQRGQGTADGACGVWATAILVE